jgi:hypothetical protein
LELISITAAFVSGMLLYYGSLGIPWQKRSWKGQTDYEQEAEARQRLMVRVGVPCAFIAYLSQAAVILGFAN